MIQYDVYVVSFCLGEWTNICARSCTSYMTAAAIIIDLLRNKVGARKDNEILMHL